MECCAQRPVGEKGGRGGLGSLLLLWSLRLCLILNVFRGIVESCMQPRLLPVKTPLLM